MKRLDLALTASDTRLVIEALLARERELLNIGELSADANEVADAGNDLIELRLLLGAVREQARDIFGPGALGLGRRAL